MQILLWALVLLVAWLLFNKYREGATSSTEYDSETCLSKASQNEQVLSDLQEQIKTLLDLQDQVANIKNQNDANTQTLSQLTTQVNSTT